LRSSSSSSTGPIDGPGPPCSRHTRRTAASNRSSESDDCPVAALAPLTIRSPARKPAADVLVDDWFHAAVGALVRCTDGSWMTRVFAAALRVTSRGARGICNCRSRGRGGHCRMLVSLRFG
jgi:hypothetical protein